MNKHLRQYLYLGFLIASVMLFGRCGDDDETGLIFSATFSSASGDVDGAEWDLTYFDGTKASGSMTIDDFKVCSDLPDAALTTERFTDEDGFFVEARIISEPTASGLEIFVIADDNASSADDYFTLGVESEVGDGTQHRLTIESSLGGTVTKVDDDVFITLAENTFYFMEVEFDFGDDEITLRIENTDRDEIAEMTLTSTYEPSRFGFIVGKTADSQLSCVDDIEVFAL